MSEGVSLGGHSEGRGFRHSCVLVLEQVFLSLCSAVYGLSLLSGTSNLTRHSPYLYISKHRVGHSVSRSKYGRCDKLESSVVEQ